jgi:hypothetical protein
MTQMAPKADLNNEKLDKSFKYNYRKVPTDHQKRIGVGLRTAFI